MEEAEQLAMVMKTVMSSWETCLAPAAASLAQLGTSALGTRESWSKGGGERERTRSGRESGRGREREWEQQRKVWKKLEKKWDKVELL